MQPNTPQSVYIDALKLHTKIYVENLGFCIWVKNIAILHVAVQVTFLNTVLDFLYKQSYLGWEETPI